MQATTEAALTKEAQVFTRYMVGEEADSLTVELYIKAHTKLNIPLTEKENKRISFIIKHTACIGMVDGALALSNTDSGIRKKLYVLFSILESNPRYSKHFLPSGKSSILSIVVAGIRAVWNALTGFILLAWI